MPDQRTERSDPERLCDFLFELRTVLQTAIRGPMHVTSDHLREQFEGAWVDVSEAFDKLFEELRKEPSIVETKLAGVGLIGMQLSLKLAGWQRAFSNLMFSSLSPKGRLTSLLRWANVILGSLAVAFPIAEILKEFKESLEADIADLNERKKNDLPNDPQPKKQAWKNWWPWNKSG